MYCIPANELPDSPSTSTALPVVRSTRATIAAFARSI
jgi:hypothetical protein